jgi:hypothetical protein
MKADWTSSVRREYIGGNPRFDFPSRPLGWARLIGVFLVGFGLLFVWMPAHTAFRSIRHLIEHGADVPNLIFGIFPLIFVFAGMLPLGIGLAILFGRSRVEWRDGQLVATEFVGPFRWTRRLPRQPIRRLEVAQGTSQTGTQAAKPMPRFSGLAVEFAGGTKKIVVMGYPVEWMRACADELKGYVSTTSAAPVEIIETIGHRSEEREVLQQPANSCVLVERSPGYLRCTIPPAGLWRGSKGLFFMGLFWCGFMVLFSAVTLKGGLKTSGWGVVGLLAFISLFWAIGIAILTAAVNMGKRTATFTVSGRHLSIVSRNLFGAKQWELAQSEIAALRADASGMEVNDKPVLELQIHPATGKKIGLLAGRDEEEIRWLATELRHALQVGARAAVPATAEPTAA